MILVIGYHRFSYNVSAGFAAVVRRAEVIAFGPHRSRALTIIVELAVTGHVHRYNTVRLHRAIGYITAVGCLAGVSNEIGKERDRKLESARKMCQEKRAASKQVA
jgi:hypothetical protein